MSPTARKAPDGSTKSTTRDKARVRREQEARRVRRRRGVVVTIAVIVVLVVVVAVVLALTGGSSGAGADPGATPSSATAEDGFVTGEPDAPVQVVIYQDYLCPFCRQLEESDADYFDEHRTAGDISVEYRPVAILDRGGRTYSARAASAVACVAELAPDSLVPFNNALYDNQPPETGEGLTTRQIAGVADEAGVPDSVRSCITDDSYVQWAQQATRSADITSTPTVLVDGETIDLPQGDTTFQAVRDTIDAAVAEAG